MNIGDHDLAARVMVIAEIGVNHDGRVACALELVHAAKAAGADAVKLQLFAADRLVAEGTGCAAYQNASDQRALLRTLELSRAEVERVVAEARRVGLMPLATPFSVEDVETCAGLRLPAIKLASPDLVNWPLLRRCARVGVPLLVSTGASDAAEIARTADWLRAWGGQAALLHCVSSYPTPADDAGLSSIAALAAHGLTVGYSDHTNEVMAGALAVTAGARVVEKHLTYDRAASGPDHAASFDPDQLAEYVRHVRLAERMRGTPRTGTLAREADVRRLSRQALAFGRALRAGERVSEADLVTRRPADGVGAAEAPNVVGRTLTRDVRSGEAVAWSMLRAA